MMMDCGHVMYVIHTPAVDIDVIIIIQTAIARWQWNGFIDIYNDDGNRGDDNETVSLISIMMMMVREVMIEVSVSKW